ncbi:uncharacterized protein CEXT_608701 [Caerostris extrusa]|uniref:Uncharacterized protein n=1 Tax=Caerostris extrusa TaxID=172846 RepID=A0AAV4R7G0_CAEEX|nr:uncharacterized protein CEXT_608701 [Caerostris extrusa]
MSFRFPAHRGCLGSIAAHLAFLEQPIKGRFTVSNRFLLIPPSEFTIYVPTLAPIASLECIDESSATSDGSRTLPPSRQISLSAATGIRYKNLGKSGLKISSVGLGTWVTFGQNLSEERQIAAIFYLQFDSYRREDLRLQREKVGKKVYYLIAYY